MPIEIKLMEGTYEVPNGAAVEQLLYWMQVWKWMVLSGFPSGNPTDAILTTYDLLLAGF